MIAKAIYSEESLKTDAFFAASKARMLAEHVHYYGKIVTNCGYSEVGKSVMWRTSGGNTLEVRKEEDGSIVILVKGRRHGIPWWCLEWAETICPVTTMDWVLLNSMSSLPPWETETGRPASVPILVREAIASAKGE